uniref:Related to complex I intermediate-associated protein CIA84 n=1 Tax=Ramularia collo-cygni TaxID=112498 RepID=A0A2D3VQR3_9PEZI
MDPGMEEMMHLAKMERMRARLPPAEEVAKALVKLMEHKKSRGDVLEDGQAALALQSLQYCSRCRAVDRDVLLTILAVLHRRVQANVAAHPDLAEAVYREMLVVGGKVGWLWKGVAMWVKHLSYSGQARRGQEVLLEWEASQDEGGREKETGKLPALIEHAWADVLHGHAQKEDEATLLATWEMLKTRGIHTSRTVKQTVLHFYLRGNDIAAVQRWFAELWQASQFTPLSKPESHQTAANDLHQVLQWCLKHNTLQFGHSIVREAMSDNPPKPIWDAIFVWAAGTGKGADEINRMLSVMEASNNNISPTQPPRLADIATINALVEFAISKNDPYLAERFIAIGKARNIEPDARTYVLQMQYRLKVNDVDGALTAYASSQAMDLSSNQDIPTVNALIVALCNSKRHDFDSIMNVAADLSDRHARFEAPTVAALSLLHLSRDEIHDVIDLLNTHAFHYSSAERQTILEAILNYALDPSTPTARTWDAYTILLTIFDEIPRSHRTTLMLDFHRRSRPDMAVHVFNSMRSHSRADTIPTISTYISSFMASAQSRDLESLQLIHNQLKLDVNINPTTKLFNALILAYTACGQPRRALRFWDDISASREGPTYNSLHITFQACQAAPFGDLKARELWTKLRKKGVEIDQELWGSYLGALAGNGDLDATFHAVQEMESEGRWEVSKEVLGKVMNGAPNRAKQKVVESWGRERYAVLWEELERVGWEEAGDGRRIFRVGREVEP